jgi:uncharacterized protein YkwD
MRLVWRGSVIVALLGVALGISWLPWREISELRQLWADPKPTKPSISEPATAGDDALASTPAPGTSPEPGGGDTGKPPTPDSKAAAEVVALVNAERAKAKCPGVKEDPRLVKVATEHSVWMASSDSFGHNSEDGSDPWKRAVSAGYGKPLAQNIAQGHGDAAAVMKSWLESAGHRANIVNCTANAVGVGVARSKDGTAYWTQLFGAE